MFIIKLNYLNIFINKRYFDVEMCPLQLYIYHVIQQVGEHHKTHNGKQVG